MAHTPEDRIDWAHSIREIIPECRLNESQAVADSALIPAGVGLAGVVAGATLTHFRWTRDRASTRRAPYEEKRREAYDGLWRVIEQAHVVARTAAPKSASAERRLIADVNAFAMVNGAYIDEADRQLAHKYISGVLKFLANLEEADRPEYREMVTSTASYSADFGPAVQHLAQESQHIESLRGELRVRVRRVLGGSPNEGG